MPDCEDNQSVASTKEAEAELRDVFSDMLGGDGMDSFMNSVSNFMTDEEFFEAEDLNTFKEIYDEYQRTPASKKKESANKLFESFSELITHKRSPDKRSPKEKRRTPKKKGNQRLANMRKELNLDEVDDEESKVTTDTSPASSAQHSTVSDASAMQRGAKLANLGANPLDVSMSMDVLFSDVDEDGPKDTSQAQPGRKQMHENNFRQRRAAALGESRSSVNNNPEETPRQNRNRRNQVSRSRSNDKEPFTRSSKITMTPMKESGQRPRSRGRATTPSRAASQSPLRSPHGTLYSSSSGEEGLSRRMTSPGRSTHSRNKTESPCRSNNSRKFEDYKVEYSSPKKTPKSPRRKEIRSVSPGVRSETSPRRRAVRSQSPGIRQETSEKPRLIRKPKTTGKSDHKRPPTESLDMSGIDPVLPPDESRFSENGTLMQSPNVTSESSKLAQKVVGSPRKPIPRNRSLKVRNNSPSQRDSDAPKPEEIGSETSGILDSAVRAKLESRLQLRKQWKNSGRSKSVGRMRDNENTEERPSLSRSNSVSRRRKETGMDGETNHGSRRQTRRGINGVVDRSANSNSMENSVTTSTDRRSKQLSRSMRGSGRSMSSKEEAPLAASFHGCEEGSSPEGKRDGEGHTTGTKQKLCTDSFLVGPAEDFMGDGRKPSGGERPSSRLRRSRSTDDVLPSNSLRRSRRSTNRNLSTSTRSTSASISASESIASGTEHSSGSTPSQRERQCRARPERRGKESGQRKGQSTESCVTKPRSVSAGRVSSRGTGAEELLVSSRARAPSNRGRNEPKTDSGRSIVTPDEILGAAMRVRSAASPQQKPKSSVGMARVKELNKNKTRSSSAPRPERSADRNHASFCGSLEALNSLRKMKLAGTDDDLVSVDPSVQTWDPSSNGRKTRTRAKQSLSSQSNSGYMRRRRQTVVKRKVPVVKKDGMETSQVSSS